MTAGARPYRGLTPDERRAERRAKLLDAAIELFGTRGYGATTIQDVCGEAGVTARHFYEAFPDREALLLAVYAEIVERHLAAVATALAGDAPPERRVRAGVAAALEAWSADERRARIAFFEVVGVSEAVEARRREVIEIYARVVADELRRVSGTRRDFTWAGRALVAATIGIFESWLALDARPPVRRLVDELEPLYAAPLER